jgi:hypothetical protein
MKILLYYLRLLGDLEIDVNKVNYDLLQKVFNVKFCYKTFIYIVPDI